MSATCNRAGIVRDCRQTIAGIDLCRNTNSVAQVSWSVSGPDFTGCWKSRLHRVLKGRSFSCAEQTRYLSSRGGLQADEGSAFSAFSAASSVGSDLLFRVLLN